MTLLDPPTQTQYEATTLVITLQQQLEAIQAENQLLKQNLSSHKEQYEQERHFMESKLKGILQENNLLYQAQEKLELELYAKEQELDTLHKDAQQGKRLYKDLDRALTLEREEFDKDRSAWNNREAQLKDQLCLLQQRQQHQKDQLRHRSFKRKNGIMSAQSTPHIPSLVNCAQEDSFAASKAALSLHSHQDENPPSPTSLEPLNLADQQTIKAQQTIIADLKSELEQQTEQHLLNSHETSLQLETLVSQVNSMKQLNQSLMEENESYQVLLHEKTLCGDFMSDPIVQLDEDMDHYFGSKKKHSNSRSGFNLADELTMASTSDLLNHDKKQTLANKEELMAEIKTLQDANRALQLYMNKILLRIVESKHLETILSIDEPNKTTSTSTIIKPTTDTVLNPRKTTSCDSFNTEDTPSTTSSDDGWDDSDASGDTGAGSGGDSWTQRLPAFIISATNERWAEFENPNNYTSSGVFYFFAGSLPSSTFLVSVVNPLFLKMQSRNPGEHTQQQQSNGTPPRINAPTSPRLHHLIPPNNSLKLSSLASSASSPSPYSGPSGTSSSPSPPIMSSSSSPRGSNAVASHAMTRERSYQREDTLPYSTPSSRPPSVRSASSYGRPLPGNRLMHSGGGHHSRRHSSYSNFSTMSETSLPWTTKDIGFNAISGVLNDPAKRGQGATKPGKADIAPVPQASIPRIRPSDFDNYIAHVGPVFEQYQYNKLTNHDANNNNSSSSNVSTYGLQADTTPHIGVLEDINSPATLVPAHQRQSSRNPYSLPPQQILSSDSLASLDSSGSPHQRDLPMLENVPSIFFEDEFYLENPRTFDMVCEGADIIGNQSRNSNHPSPISTNSILQEKLSYYLDTVEVHLLQEIENRSSSFFEALSNLQALHQQTLGCVSQIHTIRTKMKQLEKTECKDGLDVIRLQVKKRNLERLFTAISTIKDIVSVQPMIQILLGHGDYFGALDLIHETRLTLQHQDEQEVDWRSIKALVNLSTQLDEMEKAVAAMMQHDFLSMILSDLSSFNDGLKMDHISASFLSASHGGDLDDDDDDIPLGLKDRLTSSVMGLISTNALYTSIQDYKDQLCMELKNIIQRHYPSGISLDESADSSSSSQSGSALAKQLKSMPFDQFFHMLVGLFGVLLKLIERTAMYDRMMTTMINECLDRHLKSINKDDKEMVAQLEEQCELAKKGSNEVVYTISDLAHVRCGKLIGFRGDQNALLNTIDFYRLSHVIKTFIQKSELLCGRPCFGLRGTVLSQQKAFIDHFHMERLKQEAQLIENDQWMASEVPSDFQRIVDRICDGSFGTNTSSNTDHELTKAESATPSHEQPDKATKLLTIRGQSYYVVGCTLLIIKLFEDYLQCVLNLDGMATDIMQKLLELLKLFNSRVCQVILGAGAMRSAGLKNISAKHLALASQSVGVMVALTPFLKEYVGQYMPAKHKVLLSEFDRVGNDFKGHQQEIHVKLVAIMNERFSIHIKAMQVIQWDVDDTMGKQANIYMETLVKETMTLHKVLSKYLPSTDLQFIMVQVFQSFTTKLSEVVDQTAIHTDQGKARLLKDVTYFTRRLSSLQGVVGPSREVLDAVEAIKVAASDPS